jgi:phenylalanyl-tRNA synthetase beta subunit
LSHVFPNVKAGYGLFSLFEINKVHQKSDGLTDENVPIERDSIALVVTDNKGKGAAYYQAKQMLEYALEVIGVTPVYRPLETDADAAYAPFEPKRSAVVSDAKTGDVLGVVGEYKKSVQKAFKTPEYTAGFEIGPRALLRSMKEVGIRYQPLSRYPGTERDICFQVSQTVSYDTITVAAEKYLAGTELITTVSPLDIYQPEEGDTKNITIRVAITSYDKTLTNSEATEITDGLIAAVIEETKGKVI